MANDVKISELPAITPPLVGTEEIAVVKGGVTEKATVAEILAAAQSTPLITDSTAVDVAALVVDFNALLQALRDIDIIGT
jgi:hypothetical protein